MTKQWEDWIIFLGCDNKEYDNTMDVLQMWRNYVTEHGLSKDSLLELNKWFFERDLARIRHSCCLSFKSMHMEGDYIEADWIEGGGLPTLHNQFISVENKEFSEDYDSYCIRNHKVGFFNVELYAVIGMTLDGKIIIDTVKKYGNYDAQKLHMHDLTCTDYATEFLETVKENYQKSQLPDVPKGILKLPLCI